MTGVQTCALPIYTLYEFICSTVGANNNKIKTAIVVDEDAISPTESAFGLLSVLIMVTISGYSAIYFEAML